MLGQRRRRWLNIQITLFQRLVFARMRDLSNTVQTRIEKRSDQAHHGYFVLLWCYLLVQYRGHRYKKYSVLHWRAKSAQGGCCITTTATRSTVRM